MVLGRAVKQSRPTSGARRSFHYFKLEMKLLTSEQGGQVKLPKLSREPQRGPALIQICDPLDAKATPEISEGRIGASRLEFDRRVKRKRCLSRHEAGKGVTVEMVSVCGVGWPVGIRVMWRDDFYQARRFRYAMELSHKRHHIWHMFNHMTTNNLIESVVVERIWKHAQIMNDLSIRPWI